MAEAETATPTHQPSSSGEEAAEAASRPENGRAQDVNPWSVCGEVGEDGKVKPIDYGKLVDQFGTNLIDTALLERFEKVTGRKPHRFLRRQIVFSHRNLEDILDRYEKKEPFFIYTGRGPSSGVMHLGHMIPFELTNWLSEVFDVPLVVMLTDDEKYLISKDDRDIDEFENYARENGKDILACGFDPLKTFLFSDYGYMGGDLYRNVTRIARRITRSSADSCFGFDAGTNIGKIHFAAIQAASSFASSFPFLFGPDRAKTSDIPCLIPCAIDQEPYFRLTRDVASQLQYAKPSLIHARFLDGLQGPGSKMSASDKSSSILLSDTPKQILGKINGAFSGGQESMEEQRAKGGNPDVDVAYQYLRFFLEDDDELEQIRQDYVSGRLLTGELKKKCADEVSKFCTAFQKRRELVTDDVLDNFMKPRTLMCRGVPADTLVADKIIEIKARLPVRDLGSKNQQKKMEKQRLAEEWKAKKSKERKEREEVAALAGGANDVATA